MPKSNEKLANHLLVMSQLIDLLGNEDQSFSYKKAASLIRNLNKDVLDFQALPELEEFKSISPAIAKNILEYSKTGKILYLEELLERTSVRKILQLIEKVDENQARELCDPMKLRSYYDLLIAYKKGYIARFLGAESIQFQNIKNFLETSPSWFSDHKRAQKVLKESIPDVSLILKLDSIYRSKYPFTGESIKIDTTDYKGAKIDVFYSTSESSKNHRGLGDWVIVKMSKDKYHLKWVVITSTYGEFQGKRIIMGRVSECRDYYGIKK